MEKSRRTDSDAARALGRHVPRKYLTGTQLGTSDGRGWKGLLAERWRHAPGELGKVRGHETEVAVVLQGRLPVRRRGAGRLQNCYAVPGTVGLCPAGFQEEMVQLHGEIRECLHLFLPSLAETALREIDVDPGTVRLRYEAGFRDPLIEEIARAIRAEMLDPAPAGNMLAETLATALGVHLLQHHSNLTAASSSLPAARGALDPGRLDRVKDFIEANLGEDLTIEALAREACLSPFHFARAFKAATGMAPHRYLTSRRIEMARFRIAEGQLSLAEIAFRCGFSSQASFTKCSSDSSAPPPANTAPAPPSWRPPRIGSRARSTRSREVARTAWNAGFSRHSPPQASGGTDRIRRDGSNACATAPGWERRTVSPTGTLRCSLHRLQPAFQARTGKGGPRPRRKSQVAKAAPHCSERRLQPARAAQPRTHYAQHGGRRRRFAYTPEKRMHAH